MHKKFVAINLSFISGEKYISYGDISFRMRGLICHGDLVRNIFKKEVMYISVVSLKQFRGKRIEISLNFFVHVCV